MAGLLTPEDLGALLGAYALGVLDDSERRAVEEHIARDESAAAELEELQEAAMWLAIAGTPASPELWSKISDATAPREPRVLQFPPPTQRPGWRRVLAAAAAVAALVASGVLIERVTSGGSRPASEVAAGRRVKLTSVADASSVELVVRSDGTGELVESRLPRLPAGRTYQLWAIADGETRSAGVLGRDPRRVDFRVRGEPIAFMITQEEAGGVEASRNPPVVSGVVADP